MAIALSAGCSKEYQHGRKSADSPEFAAVSEMLQTLRSAPADRRDATIAAQIASGIDDARRTGLTYLLGELAKADKTQLVRVDQFGDDVYRATIQCAAPTANHATATTTKTIALLLVRQNEKFAWAGTN